MTKKVLLADDEESILLLVSATLSDDRYTLVLARDGEEALQRALDEKPDLAFLDAMMPKMDGFEVCWRLRSHDTMAQLKVVMLTALAQDSDKQRADVVSLVSVCIEIRWPQAKCAGVAEGLKGVSLVESERPDLVVLDIGLPDINGLQVLRAIREFSDVPIVMLTGQDRDVDVATHLREGADDYLVKPFSQIELISRIEAVMRRAYGRAGPNADGAWARPAGASGSEQHLYEGNVRISVVPQGNMGLVVTFAQQVREYPELRILRLADSGTDCVDIWLALRQPIPLRDILGDMEGVAEVSHGPGQILAPAGEASNLTVTLGAY